MIKVLEFKTPRPSFPSPLNYCVASEQLFPCGGDRRILTWICLFSNNFDTQGKINPELFWYLFLGLSLVKKSKGDNSVLFLIPGRACYIHWGGLFKKTKQGDKGILAAIGLVIVRAAFSYFCSLLVLVANSVEASFCRMRRLIYN